MLFELARDHRVIVCCGAGGVGKTTTAASLSVAAAELGRRVLVLTIDPSRRLAEALGVSRNPPKPVALSRDRLAVVGIEPPGSLEAWMLDPKLVTDNAVRHFAKTEEAAQSILSNRLYQQGTQMVAGLHEYAAMKALHQFITEERYDLVVLDTPPSRNALDFLDAPSRLARFLEGPIFRIFLPSEGSLWAQTGTRLVWRVIDTALGSSFAGELKAFFTIFSQLLGSLSTDLVDVRQRLSAPDVAFVLVTTSSPAALTEAHFFHDKIGSSSSPSAASSSTAATRAARHGSSPCPRSWPRARPKISSAAWRSSSGWRAKRCWRRPATGACWRTSPCAGGRTRSRWPCPT